MEGQSGQQRWQVDGPRTLEFGHGLQEFDLRLVEGSVNVVGTEEHEARLEVEHLEGEPLVVERHGQQLRLCYPELPWRGLLNWFGSKRRRRQVHLTLSVPAQTRLRLGVVSAGCVVSGVRGRVAVHSVSGDVTLVGLTGAVSAQTVSGGLEAQRLGGSLEFHTVSGNLTAVESSCETLRTESVSGAAIVDLREAPTATTEVDLATVSGEVALRMPPPRDAEVRATTNSSALTSDFGEWQTPAAAPGRPSHHRFGEGRGRVRLKSVSGPLALLRRSADATESEPFAFEER